MERRPGSKHGVRRGECRHKGVGASEAPVARRMHMAEVEHWPDPLKPAADGQNIVEAAQLLHPAHHLDAKRDGAALCRKTLPQLGELDDYGVDRLRPPAPEQEAGMHNDRRGTTRHRNASRVVEHPDRHVMLAPAMLRVTEEGSQRRMDGERYSMVAGEHSQALRVVPLHPETVAEVDLAGVVAVLNQ